MQYTRANPSPRYRELVALYARMHVEGETRLRIPAAQTFPGSSLAPHIARIKALIDATGAKSVLDYGAGKGTQYRPQPLIVDGRHVADGIAEYWDVEIECYDPGYADYSKLPEATFDGVVCTDVLEHCPEEDLPWILDEILAFARRFVYLNVACFPARKSLPNGENAHATVRPPQWWEALVRERTRSRPDLRWALHSAHPVDGKVREALVTSGSDAGVADPVVEVLLEGKKARFHAPNDMTRWRAEGLYTKEPVTIAWLREMPHGAAFADIGANVGMYTVFAALARGARVVAFEPESENYAILNRNIRLNGIADRVLALCAALSDAPAIDRLYLSAAIAGGSCHSFGEEVGFDLKPRAAAFAQGSIALRLDDLVGGGQIPAPEFVKIDVDGFEHKVIRGMERTLRKGPVRSMLVELNPALAEHVAIRRLLEQLGFAWDEAQVAAATRASGPFAGVAEHVFRR
ncbi:MAG TPA: class I SAM-dependent methyltransferase [Burkholderiales bacterium]|nr:class I SAM-dependent methyltransferase [Burkholderiales bacterium]